MRVLGEIKYRHCQLWCILNNYAGIRRAQLLTCMYRACNVFDALITNTVSRVRILAWILSGIFSFSGIYICCALGLNYQCYHHLNNSVWQSLNNVRDHGFWYPQSYTWSKGLFQRSIVAKLLCWHLRTWRQWSRWLLDIVPSSIFCYPTPTVGRKNNIEMRGSSNHIHNIYQIVYYCHLTNFLMASFDIYLSLCSQFTLPGQNLRYNDVHQAAPMCLLWWFAIVLCTRSRTMEYLILLGDEMYHFMVKITTGPSMVITQPWTIYISWPVLQWKTVRRQRTGEIGFPVVMFLFQIYRLNPKHPLLPYSVYKA